MYKIIYKLLALSHFEPHKNRRNNEKGVENMHSELLVVKLLFRETANIASLFSIFVELK